MQLATPTVTPMAPHLRGDAAGCGERSRAEDRDSNFPSHWVWDVTGSGFGGQG
jgi:hypothetical protein